MCHFLARQCNNPIYTYLCRQDVAHWISMVAVPKLLMVFVSFSFLLLVLIQPDLEFVLIMDKYLCRLSHNILWF